MCVSLFHEASNIERASILFSPGSVFQSHNSRQKSIRKLLEILYKIKQMVMICNVQKLIVAYLQGLSIKTDIYSFIYFI